MKRARANVAIGFTIGLLATLLIAALAILFVPRLRPIVGINTTVLNETNTPAATNVVQNGAVENLINGTRQEVVTKNDNIEVTSPAPYDKIDNPVTVSGSARVFENIVSIRLRDQDGTVLAESFASADAPDVGQFGDFALSLTYRAPTSTSGTLEVYWNSARDGSEEDLISIPVEF